MLLNAEKLRDSILKVGPLLPLYYWGNVLLDGKKRQEVCLGLGVLLPVVRVNTAEEAAPLLWSLHPDRAVEMFRPDTIIQAGELFCAALPELTKYYRKVSKKTDKAKQPRKVWEKQRGISRTFRLPPSLFARFQEQSAKLGMHWSEYARVCMSYGIDNSGEVLEHSRLIGPITRKPGRPKSS